MKSFDVFVSICFYLHLFPPSLCVSPYLFPMAPLCIPKVSKDRLKPIYFLHKIFLWHFFLWCLSRAFLLPDPFRVYLTSDSIQFTAMNKSQHDQIESTAHTLQFIRRCCIVPRQRKRAFCFFFSLLRFECCSPMQEMAINFNFSYLASYCYIICPLSN